jgi:hypothetical protein
MLQTKCMQSVIGIVPLLDSQQIIPNLPAVLLTETLRYAEKLHVTRKAFTEKGNLPQDFTVEIGLIAPLYYSYLYATKPEHKTWILKMLSESTGCEGPWDGRILDRLIKKSSGPVANIGSTHKWGGKLDCYGMIPPNITQW